jgi:beta-xylosidase
MKKRIFTFSSCLCFLCGIIIVSCIKTDGKTGDSVLKMNEPLVEGMYTADPSAHVFEDRLYVYPSHDFESNIPGDNVGSQFDMKDYHVFSIKDFNSPIVDHGEALKLKDIPWAKKQLWAPDAAYKNGTYYLYFPAKDSEGIFRIGVATSKNPGGPFAAQPKPIKGSFSIDPAVFVDDDGQAYMYFGGLMGGQLQCWTNGRYDAEANIPGEAANALGPRVAKMSKSMLEFDGPVKEVVIVGDDGKPVTMNDGLKMFFEASWMHKYNGVYYLSYSDGFSRSLVYATAKSPYGPFKFRGRILDPVTGWTTHHSIVQFKSKWYLFYHDAVSEDKMHLRRMKYVELQYKPDGSIKPVER